MSKEMETMETAQLLVLVAMKENKSLHTTYHLPSSTRLSEVMEKWKRDSGLQGRWVFLSAHEDKIFDDNSITLGMIKETSPLALHLNAELFADPVTKPTSEIYVCLEDGCHKLIVKPDEKLCNALWRLPGRPDRFYHNKIPLNLNHSVQQAGLQNASVICESICSIPVKLSSGETKVFKMPSNSLVNHLQEEVRHYEDNDFSLKYKGLCLKHDENVRQLKHSVEVATVAFVVNFNDRIVSWRTKDQPIMFSQFVSQLSTKGDINIQELEMCEFICIGCQRRIFNSEDNDQILPVECCKEKSLTLNVVTAQNAGSHLKTNDAAKDVQHFCDYLATYRVMDSKMKDYRGECKQTKAKFEEYMLDYNTVTQCCEKVRKHINELEVKVNDLETNIKNIKAWNFESKTKLERLLTSNSQYTGEIKILSKENKNFKNENERLDAENRKLKEDNKKLMEESDKFYDKLGKELYIIYHHDDFTPVLRPEVQFQGSYTNALSFIKCQIPAIHAGSMSFERVCAVIQQLFNHKRIRMIRQYRGSVMENTVVRVTSHSEDEIKTECKSPYCDLNGTEYSYDEAKPEVQNVRAKDEVFICGGRRRTLLWIWP